jgi:trehalose utilization protein
VVKVQFRLVRVGVLTLIIRSPLSLALITGQHAFDVPGLYALFRGMRGIDFYPQALEDWAADFGEMRDRYDALVFYNYHQALDAPGGRTWGRDVRRAVERLGETSQGIVFLHHGIGAFQAWDVWSELVGMTDRHFEYVKEQQVRVHVVDPAHPITRGLADWEIVDEVYALPAVSGDAHVLLITDHPRSTPTLAWTRQHRATRVFCYQSGHDRRVYEDLGFRTVLEQGIRWVAEVKML